jgi:hypothetical protein
MRYRSLDQLRPHARVVEASAPMTRDQRIARWADLLDAAGSIPLRALRGVEFRREPERRRLRRDNSPIAVAFADPALRADGLAGDTLWDAQRYFGLTKREAHGLLCDCHYLGEMTGHSAAKRVRGLRCANLFWPLAWVFA